MLAPNSQNKLSFSPFSQGATGTPNKQNDKLSVFGGHKERIYREDREGDAGKEQYLPSFTTIERPDFLYVASNIACVD